MMMLGWNIIGAVPARFFLRERTPESGCKKASKKMKNRNQRLVSLNCQVSVLSLNVSRKAAVSLVLHTLQNFIEDLQDNHPFRLVVSGTAGTGKSYVIKCLQRLVQQLFRANDAIQVITPTENAAYHINGRTAHSSFGIPTGGRSCNELTVPSGLVLNKI